MRSFKIHRCLNFIRSRFTQSKNKLGQDSPFPKFLHLKIRRRNGVESLTTLEEGEFKFAIDVCIKYSFWDMNNKIACSTYIYAEAFTFSWYFAILKTWVVMEKKCGENKYQLIMIIIMQFVWLVNKVLCKIFRKKRRGSGDRHYTKLR